MKNKETTKDTTTIVTFGFVALLLMLFVGCCRCKDVATIKTDSVYVTKYDTKYQYIHDSIYTDRWHNVYLSGDTVFIADSVEVFKYRFIRDTITSTDTIYKYKDTEVVKQERKHWKVAPLALIALLAIGIVKIYSRIKKSTKR